MPNFWWREERGVLRSFTELRPDAIAHTALDSLIATAQRRVRYSE
jgi:hypothetical protein